MKRRTMANLQRLFGISVGIIALVMVGISLNSLSGNYSVVAHLILVLGFVSLGVYIGAIILRERTFAGWSFCFVALYFFLQVLGLYIGLVRLSYLKNVKNRWIELCAFLFFIHMFFLVQGYLGLRALEKIDKEENDAAKPKKA